MMRIDLGATGFTSGFSQEHKYSTVGEQITVEQLTESSIVMRISVRTPVPSHIDLAGNTSYHFAASRTVFPRVSPYHGPGPFAPFGSRI